MTNHPKIEDRLRQIELAGRYNGSHRKTILRMQNEYRRAVTGRSRVMAVKTFCAECMGWDAPLASAIRACTDQGCPLHPYRPYRESDTAHSDVKECHLSGVNAG